MEGFHTHFLRETPKRDILRCPKCKSVYVDDGECESCGFRLDLDRLGDPLGERSFYALMESYEKDHTFFGIRFSKLFYSREREEAFIRKLQFRFDVLLDYFLSEKDYNNYRRRVFWTEFKTLVWEMIRRGVSHNAIADKVESHSGHMEYRIVSSEILNYLLDCGQMEIDRDRFGKFFSYRLFGVVKVAPLLVCLGLTAAAILFSLSYYKYLLIIH